MLMVGRSQGGERELTSAAVLVVERDAYGADLVARDRQPRCRCVARFISSTRSGPWFMFLDMVMVVSKSIITHVTIQCVKAGALIAEP